MNRRGVLRVGAAGIAAAGSPFGWAGQARAQSPHAGEQSAPSAAQAVIYLWMAGGVTHLESLDPKPAAPEEIRGTLGAIATKLPGVYFAETCPGLAQVADKLAVVRSYSHDNNDHFLSQAWALSGRPIASMAQVLSEPNIGSIVSSLHGPRADLPGYIAVPGVTRPGPPPHNLFTAGWLGNQYAPFAVGGEPEQPDFTVGDKLANPPGEIEEPLAPKDLSLPDGFGADRLSRRAELRKMLDRALSDFDRQSAWQPASVYYQQALSLLASPKVREAFEVSREPEPLRQAYGRTKIGQRCLLARRLVEAGARFVMVDYGYDPDYGNLWDNHAVPVQKQPHISEMAKRPYHVAGMDRAFAALIADLAARGMLESTLVVFMTEFGRTPKINADGGRDHWGPAGSIFFAGGGTQGGQVIGATDKQGAFPTSRPHSPGDVAATLYKAIGIDPETRVFDRQDRPVPVLPIGEPIAGVLG